MICTYHFSKGIYDTLFTTLQLTNSLDKETMGFIELEMDGFLAIYMFSFFNLQAN